LANFGSVNRVLSDDDEDGDLVPSLVMDCALPIVQDVVKYSWDAASATGTRALIKLWKELVLFVDASCEEMKDILRTVLIKFTETGRDAFLPTDLIGQVEANEAFKISGAIGECACFINQNFRRAAELVNDVKAFQGVDNPEVWICHAVDGKWRMQHAPDKGTVKAYGFTTGCTPVGVKDWGVWVNGMWGEQRLIVMPVTERPEATKLCDKLFGRACKLLCNLCCFDGVIASIPLQRVAFTVLVDPLLLPHIRAQVSVSTAIQKAKQVVDCLPESWFKFSPPKESDGFLQQIKTVRNQAGVMDTTNILTMYRKLNMKM